MNTELAMDWSGCFAKRTALMKSSALRELMKVTARPDVISFAGGLPGAELFPLPQIKSAFTAVLAAYGGQALQYSETPGLPELRDWLARRFSNGPLQVTRENVLITSGAQQALDLVGRILLEEGDHAIVENPTYLALLSAWRPTGAGFLPVACDEGGLQVEHCKSLMQRKPKAIYCVPNFQNPQGVTLTLSRRKKLVALARQHSMAIIEDNPYAELRYSGSALPNLLELDARNGAGSELESRVIHVGTFSEVLMPGLRVGWVIAAREVIEKMTLAKQAADLQSSTLCQHLALELVRRGFLEKFVPVLRQHYGQRRDAMLMALEKYFPQGASWTKPEGGIFVWVTLPKRIDAASLLPAALGQRVAFVPGEEFQFDRNGRNTMRLNFTNATRRGLRKELKDWQFCHLY